MSEPVRPVYEATLYHDGEFDAAIESTDIGYFPSLTAATAAINAQRGAYWQSGGIRAGWLLEAIPGKRPERFEADQRTTSWFVGTDGKAYR
jgi:hypothetical protein